MDLFGRWATVLDELDGQARRRTFSGSGGIDFTSNDYLGYARRPPSQAVPVGPEVSPRSGRASRLLGGNHPIWEEVEDALADWHGAEAALMMTSGYVANEGLLSAIVDEGDWVASDEYNHASIVDGLRLNRPERFVYRHNDLNHLEQGLRLAVEKRRPGQERFLVTESLFSMEGDCAPLTELAELAERFGAHLVVDEAHATGCFGPGGSGLVDAAGLRQRVLATVHTGGKALGVMGAYICGCRRLKEWLTNRCRHLIYTTALPPAMGAWWLEALRRVQQDSAGRRALHAAAAHFRAELGRMGITAPGRHYIVPVFLGEDRRAMQAAARLQAGGWDMRAVRPPSVPPGTARLRVSIHADHDRQTLAAAASALAKALDFIPVNHVSGELVRSNEW